MAVRSQKKKSFRIMGILSNGETAEVGRCSGDGFESVVVEGKRRRLVFMIGNSSRFREASRMGFRIYIFWAKEAGW
jgi:hypothetical protein